MCPDGVRERTVCWRRKSSRPGAQGVGTDYQTLFAHYRACSIAWSASDMDALCALEDVEPRLSADATARFVEAFCSRVEQHVEEDGPDVVGDVIWYLMGGGQQVWHDIGEAEHEAARDAILSLRTLYERCFALHLTGWKGVGLADSRLETACYMLWDMDGGLETIPMLGAPEALVAPCYKVLRHVLSLNSPACWESALHGLGHLIAHHRDPGRGLIDAFLQAKGRLVPDDLRRYAASARKGGVQ